MTLASVAYQPFDNPGTRLEALWADFAPVGPELLARRALLRRVDTKFLLGQNALEDVLGQLTADYGILLAGSQRLTTYRTLYFDTCGLQMFHDHRRGRRPRQKVRIRHYDDRELSYVEIKTKHNERLTIKHRRPIPYDRDGLDLEALGLLAEHCRISPDELRPQIWTNFRRLTLVGLQTNERVTIDVDLGFVHGDGSLDVAGVVILEVKQSPFSARTPIWRALRSRGLRPRSVSKYCTGTAMTRSGVRYNRLKPAVRAVREVAR